MPGNCKLSGALQEKKKATKQFAKGDIRTDKIVIEKEKMVIFKQQCLTLLALFLLKTIIRRGLAAFIDYSCIMLYALLLFGMAVLVRLPDLALSPLAGQLLGMLTLTIPAVTCFILWEKGPHRATPGKRAMGLVVLSDKPGKRTSDIMLRNVIKFLPWEIAHTGLHWLFYYNRMDAGVPSWVMVLLIVPQIILFVYLLSILLEKKGRSLYDRWSDTRVVYKVDVA